MAYEIDQRVPSTEELSSLPRWAIVAFAARCAERVEPLFKKAWPHAPNSHLLAVERAVQGTKEAAASAFADVASAKRNALSADLASYEADFGGEAIPESGAYFAAHSASNAAGSVAYIDSAAGLAHYAAYDAYLALSSISNLIDTLIKKDFELLKRLAKDQNWNDDTPVSPQVFSLHSEFDIDVLFDGHTIIDVSKAIDAKLVEYFLRFPKRLYELNPRQFEELIAELFDGFGFEVELTAATRDNGRDVIAIQNTPVRLKYLIECKRYAPTHKVGIAIVQRLQGVTLVEGANKGIIVTTSRFTDPALEALKATPWLLEGRDFDGLVEWLDLYQKFQMATLIEPSNDIYAQEPKSAYGKLAKTSLNIKAEYSQRENAEDNEAKLESYYAWERAGRPSLSQEEQERMYFEALARIRRRAT